MKFSLLEKDADFRGQDADTRGDEPSSVPNSIPSVIPGLIRDPEVITTDTGFRLAGRNDNLHRFSLLQKILLVLFIIALGAGSTAYYLRDSAFAATYMNKYLDHQITSGLVGHWTFDGSDMTATTALDKSGNGNTGTLTNMATSSRVAGKLGQALQFMGTNTNSKITISPITSSTTYSIMTWIRPTGTGGQFQNIIADTYVLCFEYEQTTKKLYFEYNGNQNRSTRTIPSNQWSFVGVVVSGGNLTFYINGVAAGTTGNIGSINYRYIGSDPQGEYLNGTLDDLRFYNRALSQKEITRLYKLGEGVKFNVSPNTVVDDGLVGHWTFDGQNMNGNSAYDLSSTHATGTLTNMASSSRVGGKLGQGLQFDGVNDYVAYPLHSLALTPRTYSVWVKLNSTSTDQILISKDTIFLRYNPASGGSFGFYWTGGYEHYSGGFNPVKNRWYHVVGVLEGPSLKLYVDGVEKFSVIDGIGTPNCCSTALEIGGNSATWLLDGTLDDVRIYNRVLSAKEIQRLYQAGGGITVTPDILPPFICGVTPITDSDGNSYGSRKIGSQCWMDRNLNTGTRIDNTSPWQTNNATVEKYCYNDTASNCSSTGNPTLPDGGLYMWDEARAYGANGSRGICPTGWHIPTDSEWFTLETYYKTGTCTSNRDSLWQCSPAGTSLKPSGVSNLNANLSGYASYGLFANRTLQTYFWSSTQYDSSNMWIRGLSSGESNVWRGTWPKTGALPVRCLKD